MWVQMKKVIARTILSLKEGSVIETLYHQLFIKEATISMHAFQVAYIW